MYDRYKYGKESLKFSLSLKKGRKCWRSTFPSDKKIVNPEEVAQNIGGNYETFLNWNKRISL